MIFITLAGNSFDLVIFKIKLFEFRFYQTKSIREVVCSINRIVLHSSVSINTLGIYDT